MGRSLAVVGAVAILALAIAVPRYLERIERQRGRRTMSDMKALAVGLYGYRVDHGTYPAVPSIRLLPPFLDPEYIRNPPQEDGWGRHIEYVAFRGPSYVLRSAGADGTFDAADPRGYPDAGSSWSGDDIVILDGQFLVEPEGVSRTYRPALTDVGLLRERLVLPPDVSEVAWRELPVNDPAPSLYAYLEKPANGSWPELLPAAESRASPPVAPTDGCFLPWDAQEVLHERLGHIQPEGLSIPDATLTWVTGGLRITGKRLDASALAKAGLRPSCAVVVDGGLLVVMVR